MALWACSNCAAAYAVGLQRCPQCGSTDYQEDSMPKISKLGGPSYEPGREPGDAAAPAVENAGDVATPAAEVPDAAAAAAAAQPEAAPDPAPAPPPGPAPAPARAQPKKADA